LLTGGKWLSDCGVKSDAGSPAVAWHIEKAALALGEPRRCNDRAHLRFVSVQAGD
jgi:hypothetical protein